MSTPPLHTNQKIAEGSYWTYRGSHWTSRWCYGLSIGISAYIFVILERSSAGAHLFAEGNHLATDALLALAYLGILSIILTWNTLIERALERYEQRAVRGSVNPRIAYLVFLSALTIGLVALRLASPFRP